MNRIDGTMITKGQEIVCESDLKVMGKTYFTKDKVYTSPENNCLTDNFGNDVFVQQQYLPHFILKV